MNLKNRDDLKKDIIGAIQSFGHNRIPRDKLRNIVESRLVYLFLGDSQYLVKIETDCKLASYLKSYVIRSVERFAKLFKVLLSGASNQTTKQYCVTFLQTESESFEPRITNSLFVEFGRSGIMTKLFSFIEKAPVFDVNSPQLALFKPAMGDLPLREKLFMLDKCQLFVHRCFHRKLRHKVLNHPRYRRILHVLLDRFLKLTSSFDTRIKPSYESYLRASAGLLLLDLSQERKNRVHHIVGNRVMKFLNEPEKIMKENSGFVLQLVSVLCNVANPLSFLVGDQKRRLKRQGILTEDDMNGSVADIAHKTAYQSKEGIAWKLFRLIQNHQGNKGFESHIRIYRLMVVLFLHFQYEVDIFTSRFKPADVLAPLLAYENVSNLSLGESSKNSLFFIVGKIRFYLKEIQFLKGCAVYEDWYIPTIGDPRYILKQTWVTVSISFEIRKEMYRILQKYPEKKKNEGELRAEAADSYRKKIIGGKGDDVHEVMIGFPVENFVDEKVASFMEEREWCVQEDIQRLRMKIFLRRNLGVGLPSSFNYLNPDQIRRTQNCKDEVVELDDGIRLMTSAGLDVNTSRYSLCNYCKTQEKKMKKCAACKSALYCGVKCQKMDWKEHKVVCKKIRVRLERRKKKKKKTRK